MDTTARNRLVALGLVWGLAFAVAPAVFAFDDPFTLSPFLVSAFVCSALAGVAGALLTGRWVSGRSGMLVAFFAGVFHGVVFSVVASVSIWICLAVNISGFSTATPGNIFELVRSPGIFEVSGVAAAAILAYSLAAGLLLSPISGSLLVRAARTDGGKFAEAA